MNHSREQIMAATRRELDAMGAAALGWKRWVPGGDDLCPPDDETSYEWSGGQAFVLVYEPGDLRGKAYRPSESLDQAALLEAEIKRRNLQDQYAHEIEKLAGADKMQYIPAIIWHVRRAKPEQITKACLLALKGGE